MAGKPRSLAYIHAREVIGARATTREVDLIASVESREREIGSCGVGKRVAADYEIAVRDRRTGQQLATKTFAAELKCPASISWTEEHQGPFVRGEPPTIHNWPAGAPIRTWLKTFVR